MKKLAVFASGTGSNVENLINYFKTHTSATLSLIVSNNSKSGAIEKANAHNIPVLLLEGEHVKDGKLIAEKLTNAGIDYIVLAGYLKMIPAELIKAFPEKIINIHPALLPKFGGKGMYGSAIHKAVVEKGETESGITVHFVNEEYDKGRIIAQKSVKLEGGESYVEVEQKVRALEIEWFPKIIEQVILS